MSDLQELYQQVILEHNKHPKNYGEPSRPHHTEEGCNPLCGDRLSVHLIMNGDVVEDIRFEGEGCAISKASASMMTMVLKGKSRSEALDYFENFHKLVTDEEGRADIQKLGKLSVFAGVRQFPMRVKCATLAWHTSIKAMEAASPDKASAGGA